MATIKKIAAAVSWAFFAGGVVWIFFGLNILPSEDCNPRALLGCGLLDIGLNGVLAVFTNMLGKLLVVLSFWGVWALLQKFAHGKWPSLPGDPK